MKKHIPTVASIIVAFVFIQSMFFKFTGAEETMIIFRTISEWLASIGVPAAFASLFSDFGAYAVGAVELVAAALILIPATRAVGASLSLSVISAAIFFHLFTPLGIDRVVDQAGNTDGGALFYTAVVVWLSSAVAIALGKWSAQGRNEAAEYDLGHVPA